jgi:hypothetical protein
MQTYKQPSDNPAWTVAEMLYHLSIAPRFVGEDVKIFLRLNWLYLIIPIVIPKKLFDWFIKEFTRYGARRATPLFLAQQYDKAHAAALKALAGVGDEDFARRLYYPDWDPILSGEVTLEMVFHYIKAHFDSHASQLRQIASKDMG